MKAEVPQGWLSVPLVDVATLHRGFDLPHRERRPGSVPVMTSSGQNGTHAVSMVNGPGVITGRSGTIGRVFYCADDFWPHNTALYVSDFHGNEPKFIACLLESLKLDKFVAATGVPSLNRNFVHPIPVAVPPLPEQRKIAAILSSVDDAIEKTETVIEQVQVVKRGLMQELFTRGLPGRHTRFRETEVGEIPEEWSVVNFGRLVELFIDFRGRTPKKLGMEWGGGDFPALSAMNVQMGYVDLCRKTYYGSDSLYQRWMTSGPARKGDVLLTMEAPLGNVAQVPDDRRYILSQRVLLIRPGAGRMSSDFLAQLMRADVFQSQLNKNATGTTARGIQRKRLVEIPVRVPPLAEQSQIAGTLIAIDSRLSVKGGTKLDQMAEENQTTWPLGRVSENGCAKGGVRMVERQRRGGRACCVRDDSCRRSAPGCGRDESADRAARQSAVRSRRSRSIR